MSKRSVLFFLVFFVLCLWRFSDRWMEAQFFSEDALFFEEHLRGGWSALLKPYAGYFHTMPRLVAGAVAAWVPIAWWGVVKAVVCLLVFCFACFRFTGKDFENVFESYWLRVFIALMFTTSPGLYEVLGNTPNLHWILNFYIGLLALRKLHTKLNRLELSFFTLAVLSTGESIVFVPVYLWRAWRESRESGPLRNQNLWLAGLLVLSFVLSFIFKDASKLTQDFSWNRSASAVFHYIVNHILLLPLLGAELTRKLPSLPVAYWLMIVGSAFFIVRFSKHKLLNLVTIFFACIPVLIMLVRIESSEYIGLFRLHNEISIHRYGYVVWGILFLFFMKAFATWAPGRMQSFVIALFFSWTLYLNHNQLRIGKHTAEPSWQESIVLLQANCQALEPGTDHPPTVVKIATGEIRLLRSDVCR